MNKKYIALKDLEVYQLSRKLSELSWSIYEKMDWQKQKIIGDQFIRSADSVGANIAEGYARFYYLDKARFYYNSRASLSEACNHWLELMLERGLVEKQVFFEIKNIHKSLEVKLNNMITITKKSKQGHDEK